MLAVYYVTLPIDNPSVNSDDLIVSSDNTSNLDNYAQNLENKYNDQLKNNER